MPLTQDLTKHLGSVVFICVLKFTFPLSQPRKPAQKRAPINASTADEAIEKMLEQKKISCKINYDVLKDLNRSSMKSPPPEPKESPGRAAQRRSPSARPRRRTELSTDLPKQASSFGKRCCVFHIHCPPCRWVWSQVSHYTLSTMWSCSISCYPVN